MYTNNRSFREIDKTNMFFNLFNLGKVSYLRIVVNVQPIMGYKLHLDRCCKIFENPMIVVNVALLHNESNSTFSKPSNSGISVNLEDERKILEKLNSLSVEELSQLGVTRKKCKSLIAYRQKQGPFVRLLDIQTISGVGKNSFNTLCQIMLNGKKTRQRPKSVATYVIPDVKPDQLHNIQRIVGVSVCYASRIVSWTGIELTRNSENKTTLRLNEWNLMKLPLAEKIRNHHEISLLNIAYDLVSAMRFANADAYVMESSYMSPEITSRSGTNSLLNQQKLQLSSMLLTLFNGPIKSADVSKVYFQQNLLWCRLYGTLIGSEKVSTRMKVEEFLINDKNDLFIPQHLKEAYNLCTALQQDALGASFLLTLSFIQINLLQDAESINKLKKRSAANKVNNKTSYCNRI